MVYRSLVTCALVALICALAGFGWQFLTVHYNYGGNWTSLYITGSKFPVPPSLAGEGIHVLPESTGYDGQMYHYVAHDPFLHDGLASYTDMPRVRYRRILLPLAAYLLAAGRQSWIDPAYIATNLTFLFLGAWWLGQLLLRAGRNPILAILFVLVPASLISLDRLTIDLSFTALCIGFAFYSSVESSRWKLFAVLAAASLCRETGFVLVIAYCIAQLARRRFGRSAVFATTALPAIVWYVFLDVRTPAIAIPAEKLIPFRGLISIAASPFPYPFDPLVNTAITSLDYLVFAGMGLTLILALWLFRKKPLGHLEIAIACWAVIAVCLPREFWADCCASGRVFSPLLVLLALRNIADPGITFALPLLLVSPRTWLQLLSPFLGIVRGIFTAIGWP